MNLDERLWWFIIGGMLGFALGYTIHGVYDIKAKLDEVSAAIKAHAHDPVGTEGNLSADKQGDTDVRHDVDKEAPPQ